MSLDNEGNLYVKKRILEDQELGSRELVMGHSELVGGANTNVGGLERVWYVGENAYPLLCMEVLISRVAVSIAIESGHGSLAGPVISTQLTLHECLCWDHPSCVFSHPSSSSGQLMIVCSLGWHALSFALLQVSQHWHTPPFDSISSVS